MTIYFARVGDDGPIKIGHSTAYGRCRLPGLQVGCPWPINIIGDAEGDQWQERVLHKALSKHRMCSEWFAAHPEVIDTMNKVLGGKFQWPDRMKVA